MYIESKYKDNDEYCFVLKDDSGIMIAISMRGLYMEDNILALQKAGYKYLDYHGHILTPDNISLEDLAESPCPLSISDMQHAHDCDEQALTEERATKYFVRGVDVEEIELKEPKIRIKTREELIEYLNSYASKQKVGLESNDVLPLNSFVAPEALFTLKELQQDNTINVYMRLIEDRRIIKNYDAYEKLISFLQSEGVLGKTFTASDVKKAYSAWGICGIRAKVVDMQERLGAVESIFEDDYPNRKNNSTVAETLTTCLLDKEGRIHHSNGIADIINEPEFDILPVRPAKEDDYWEYMHNKNKWTTELKPLQCIIRQVQDRTYLKLMDDDCIEYKARIDTNRWLLANSRGIILTQRYLFMQMYDGSNVSINKVLSRKEYEAYNLCLAKVRTLVKQKTITPLVTNSYQMLLEQGLNYASAVRYATRCVQESREASGGNGDISLYKADEYYAEGPAAEYIKKYNPDELPYKTLDELIEIMCATRDDMESRGEYLSVNNSAGSSITEKEMIERPVEKLEFVKNFKEGHVNIGWYESGLLEDGEVEYDSLVGFIQLLVRAISNSQELEGLELQNLLNDIEQSKEYIDFDSVIKERKSAYRGMILDKAVLNGRRAEESIVATVVTRVFREIANLPAKMQRHYMFDCITLDLSDRAKNKMAAVQREIANAIELAADGCRNIDYVYKKAIKYEAMAVALDLMFRLAFSEVETKPIGEHMQCSYEYHAGTDAVQLKIVIPKNVYTEASNRERYEIGKCCTLDDWCEYEMCGNRFRMYCLNANITPWRVTPKKGVTLSSYPFAINFIHKDVLEEFPEEFKARVQAENARVTCLYYKGEETILKEDFGNMGIKYQLENIDEVLDPYVSEKVTDYFERFRLHKMDAENNGKYLERMRLKSDIIYKNYAKTESADYMSAEEDDYVDLGEDKEAAKLWLTSIEVLPLGEAKVKLGVTGNVIESFYLGEQDFSDLVRWKELMNKTYKSSAVVMIYGTTMVSVGENGRSMVNLIDISKEECDKLVDNGIFYRLGAREYYIKTGNGSYKLEVR